MQFFISWLTCSTHCVAVKGTRVVKKINNFISRQSVRVHFYDNLTEWKLTLTSPWEPKERLLSLQLYSSCWHCCTHFCCDVKALVSGGHGWRLEEWGGRGEGSWHGAQLDSCWGKPMVPQVLFLNRPFHTTPTPSTPRNKEEVEEPAKEEDERTINKTHCTEADPLVYRLSM